VVDKQISVDDPVRRNPTEKKKPELSDGIGLALSGGGYRAMLFQVGSLWRLYEAGIFPHLERVASVSGASITAAFLGIHFEKLLKQPHDPRSFRVQIAEPLRVLANCTIDDGAAQNGVILPGSIAAEAAEVYRAYLFGAKTLQDLPDRPSFVINCTNVQTGSLWRFSKPCMADCRVGKLERPDVPLATVVAASSAYPPVLSPVELRLDRAKVAPLEGADLHEEPYTSSATLTDGSFYDSLALETVWKEYRTILVSDAGASTTPEPSPKGDWGRHAHRILNIMDVQIRGLRKRQLIEQFREYLEHDGAYWGIGSHLANYPVQSRLECPARQTEALADIPTRLKQLLPGDQERLINWGYAITDVALRSHLPARVPGGHVEFPYPDSGV